MSTATLSHPTTEAYSTFVSSLAEKNPDPAALAAAFERLANSERFDALVLGFDTLVDTVRTEGVTPWSASLLADMETMSIRFMSQPHLVDGRERRIGLRIENAVFAGLRGKNRGARRPVPFAADDLVSTLIAGLHGHTYAQLPQAKRIAAVATENFTVFRSAGDITVPASN